MERERGTSHGFHIRVFVGGLFIVGRLSFFLAFCSVCCSFKFEGQLDFYHFLKFTTENHLNI